MRSSLFFVVCIILNVAFADITVLEYDFENVPYGTLVPPPSDQASGVTGLDFTVDHVQNNGVTGWLCADNSNCFDAIFLSGGSSGYNFGFSSTIPYTLTGISFTEGNNDCQFGFGPVCDTGAAFAVEYSTDSSFSSATTVGTFTPPSGSFQIQAYSFPFSLSVVPGTTYYFRFAVTQSEAIGTGQYMFDDVLISGTAPTPQQICEGFSYAGEAGYFCSSDTTGYYYCLAGAFAPLDSLQTCAPGTSCTCAWGVECSEGGLESPCRNADSP